MFEFLQAHESPGASDESRVFTFTGRENEKINKIYFAALSYLVIGLGFGSFYL